MIAHADILTAPDYRLVQRMEYLRMSLGFAVMSGRYERASFLADCILDLWAGWEWRY